MDYLLPPFNWGKNYRSYLKDELVNLYAACYSLKCSELHYILDPQDVYGEKFPGETFRVLKEKDLHRFGDYRTRRLVLEAYDRLRPAFDMEEYLKRFEEVMEEYRGMTEVTLRSETNSILPRTRKIPKEPNQKDIFDRKII